MGFRGFPCCGVTSFDSFGISEGIKMDDYDIALKIVQGETIDRKHISDIEGLKRILKSFSNNCKTVIKQLKEG